MLLLYSFGNNIAIKIICFSLSMYEVLWKKMEDLLLCLFSNQFNFKNEHIQKIDI